MTSNISKGIVFNGFGLNKRSVQCLFESDFTEDWSKLCQSATKPLAELAELNVKTLGKIAKNAEYFNELLQAKKPEDFVAAQMKLANVAGLDAIRYAQDAYSICLESATQAGKAFTDYIRETSSKATEFGKQAKAEDKK